MIAPTTPYTGFNPRPREGGDEAQRPKFELITVSIHAPAKGATHPGVAFSRSDNVSIHAPAKGATSSKS